MSWVSREWHQSNISGERTKGKKKPTNTLFLTFCNSSLPKDIRVGYLRVKVARFILNPFRCFKCQKYRHGAQRCNSSAVCPKCPWSRRAPVPIPPPPATPPSPSPWTAKGRIHRHQRNATYKKQKKKYKRWKQRKIVLSWCVEICTGNQLLIAAWRKTSFCVVCGQADGVLFQFRLLSHGLSMTTQYGQRLHHLKGHKQEYRQILLNRWRRKLPRPGQEEARQIKTNLKLLTE